MNPLERPPVAVIELPGSKSHTNRALLCAALADGESVLDRVLIADDTEAMLGVIESLGAVVDRRPDGTVVIDGSAPHGPRSDGLSGGAASNGPLDSPEHVSRQIVDVRTRQSGTTSRFVLPVLATLAGHFRLDGDPQLRSRPFGPQLDALRQLGAAIEGSGLPLLIDGHVLSGGKIKIEGSTSSQFLSGLLLAAPLMSGPLSIEVDGHLVSKPYVALTIDTMARFGQHVEVVGDFQRFECRPGRYQAAEFSIEPDASAASYFFAAAAITGGTVRINGLDSSTVQGDLAFTRVLEQMGATVETGPGWTSLAGTGELRGTSVDMSDISDTAQTLAVVASFASTPTEMTGIGFIRRKETDRIAATVAELNRRGIEATATDDGLIVYPGVARPGVVQTYDDHRMAMSFALLGLVHDGIEIADPRCVNKTFPTYFTVLEQLRSNPPA